MNSPDYHFFEGGGWPDSLKLANGSSVNFNTDFRAWLKYEKLCGDTRFHLGERNLSALALCYKGVKCLLSKADTVVELLTGAAWFHSCGDAERIEKIKISDRAQEDLKARSQHAPYSHYWDFLDLWAAFKLAYNIDLYKTDDLHWWEFQALFINLPANNSLNAVRQLRGMTRDEFMGKSKPEKQWGRIVLDQKIKALPEGQ